MLIFFVEPVTTAKKPIGMSAILVYSGMLVINIAACV